MRTSQKGFGFYELSLHKMLILFRTIVADPGWVKSQDPDPGSGSRMNNLDHISESLETIFGLKY